MALKLGDVDINELTIGDEAYLGGIKVFPRRWNPADMTTLAWYDAEDASTITAPGGDVEQWADKSGFGRDISQSNGPDKPTFAADTVTFDGVTQHLFNTAPFMFDNGGVNIFIVGNLSGAAADARMVAEGSSTNTLPIYAPVQSKNGAPTSVMSAFIRNDAATAYLNGPVLSASGALDNTQKLYDWLDTGSVVSGSVNGSTPVNVGYTRSGVTTLNTFCMGGILRATFIAPMAGGVNEVVITHTLTADDRQKVEGYLAWKWGLEANLAAGHLYEDEPPCITPLLTLGDLNPRNWYDAQDASTIIATGNDVDQWTDKMGNHNLTSTGTARPKTGTATYNGHNVIAFDGIDDSLNNLSYSLLITNVSWIGIRRLNTLAGVRHLTIQIPGNTGLLNETGGTTNFTTGFRFVQNESITWTPSNPTDTHIVSYVKNTAFEQKAYDNGLQTGQSFVQISNWISQQLYLGSSDISWSHMDWMELAIFPIATNSLIRQQAEGAMAWKWGIEGLLPNDHPYKNAPPRV